MASPDAMVSAAHLCDAGQLAQVELVVELDGGRQEVVHDVAVQLNCSIHQLARQLDDFRVKALLLQVPINHGKVDGPAPNTSHWPGPLCLVVCCATFGSQTKGRHDLSMAKLP